MAQRAQQFPTVLQSRVLGILILGSVKSYLAFESSKMENIDIIIRYEILKEWTTEQILIVHGQSLDNRVDAPLVLCLGARRNGGTVGAEQAEWTGNRYSRIPADCSLLGRNGARKKIQPTKFFHGRTTFFFKTLIPFISLFPFRLSISAQSNDNQL